MGEIEDRLERLAAHRATQIPEFSMPTADELVVRLTPRVGASQHSAQAEPTRGEQAKGSSPFSGSTDTTRPCAGSCRVPSDL